MAITYNTRYTEPVTMTVNRFRGEQTITIFTESWVVTCSGYEGGEDGAEFDRLLAWAEPYVQKELITIDHHYSMFDRRSLKKTIYFNRNAEYMEFVLRFGCDTHCFT